MEIELLADYPDSIPALVECYVSAWEPYYGENGPGDAQAELESRTNRDAIPIGFIATENGEICGAAALDLDVSTGFVPSVVGLYVLPSQRGRGVAKALIEFAGVVAKRLGYVRLYVSTNVLGGLLERMGWYPIGDVEFVNDEQGIVYGRDL